MPFFELSLSLDVFELQLQSAPSLPAAEPRYVSEGNIPFRRRDLLLEISKIEYYAIRKEATLLSEFPAPKGAS